MAEILRRVSVEDPAAVFAAADRPVSRQAAERAGDRLALGADEVGEALVAERERDDDAVGVDSAPAFGEVPEREQEAVADALVVRDRERYGEVVGAPRPAVEELEAELWPGDDALHEGVIEDGEAGRFERGPADLRSDVGALVVPAPRAHDVAVADELDAVAAQHVDGPGEQSVDDHEAVVVLGRLVRRGRVPDARGEPVDARDRFATRLIYRADQQRFENPQPATAVIAQLVASSFKKEDSDTRGFQKDGYRYSPIIARLLEFIPPHQPEGYVGWNVQPGTDLSGYGRESISHVRGTDSVKLQSKGPTIPLWHERQINYMVALTTPPHYRYRLDYLTPIGQDTENLPAAPKIQPAPPGSKAAAEAYKIANSHYRLHNRTPGSEKIIGVNNFGEIVFDWGQSYKAVIHTLRWHAKTGSVWTTYRVSLNPNDLPDIKDGTN